jgi:hypothetical protein
MRLSRVCLPESNAEGERWGRGRGVDMRRWGVGEEEGAMVLVLVLVLVIKVLLPLLTGLVRVLRGILGCASCCCALGAMSSSRGVVWRRKWTSLRQSRYLAIRA